MLVEQESEKDNKKASLSEKKIIRVGIFGGMGAIAGSAFYYKLTLAFQGCREESQPMVILLSDPTIPRRDQSLEKALSGIHPKYFIEKVLYHLASFKRSGVNFVVVPCNTFHYFREELQRMSGVPILNMIDIVCQFTLAQEPNLRKVGLLSTYATAKSGMYQTAFHKYGVEVVLPEANEQEKLNFIIEQVKVGSASEELTRQTLRNVINAIERRGVNKVILGCTELPEVAQYDCYHGMLIDTTEALVKGTVNEVNRLAISSSRIIYPSIWRNIGRSTELKAKASEDCYIIKRSRL